MSRASAPSVWADRVPGGRWVWIAPAAARGGVLTSSRTYASRSGALRAGRGFLRAIVAHFPDWPQQ